MGFNWRRKQCSKLFWRNIWRTRTYCKKFNLYQSKQRSIRIFWGNIPNRYSTEFRNCECESSDSVKCCFYQYGHSCRLGKSSESGQLLHHRSCVQCSWKRRVSARRGINWPMYSRYTDYWMLLLCFRKKSECGGYFFRYGWWINWSMGKCNGRCSNFG